MTIQEAINAARVQRDTELPDEVLAAMLSSYDENLYDRVLVNYGWEKPETIPYHKYMEEHEDLTLEDLELMLPDKYGLQLYPLYLLWNIDLQHGDYERYNNDVMMFSQLEGEMRKDISRTGQWKPPRPEGWPENRPWDGRINIRF